MDEEQDSQRNKYRGIVASQEGEEATSAVQSRRRSSRSRGLSHSDKENVEPVHPEETVKYQRRRQAAVNGRNSSSSSKSSSRSISRRRGKIPRDQSRKLVRKIKDSDTTRRRQSTRSPELRLPDSEHRDDQSHPRKQEGGDKVTEHNKGRERLRSPTRKQSKQSSESSSSDAGDRDEKRKSRSREKDGRESNGRQCGRGRDDGGGSPSDSSGDGKRRDKKDRKRSSRRRSRRHDSSDRGSSVGRSRSRSRASNHARFQFMKPPKFEGKGLLEEFIIAFENCAIFNKWSSSDKAAHLRNSLTGTATQLLRDSANSSYAELLAKLERRYGTKNMQEKYRTELRCRRRRKDEPVTELAEAIRGLMMLAYPGEQSDAMSVVMARDSFLAALNDPDLEERVRYHEPQSIDDACRIAQRFEVIRSAVRA